MKAMLIRLRPWGLVIVALGAATLAVAGTVWWCEREPASPFGDQNGLELLYRTTVLDDYPFGERPPTREDMIEAKRRWETVAAGLSEDAAVEVLEYDLVRLRLPGLLLIAISPTMGPDPGEPDAPGGLRFSFWLMRLTEYHEPLAR